MSRVRSPSPASKTNRKAQCLPVVLFHASGLFSARNAQAHRRWPSAWPRRQRRTDLDRERLRTTPNDTVLCGFVRTTGKVNGEGHTPGRPQTPLSGIARSPAPSCRRPSGTRSRLPKRRQRRHMLEDGQDRPVHEGQAFKSHRGSVCNLLTLAIARRAFEAGTVSTEALLRPACRPCPVRGHVGAETPE